MSILRGLGQRFQNLGNPESHRFWDFVRWKFLERVPQPARLAPPLAEPANGTWKESQDSATWIGHSSFLLRLAGKTLLVDPVFSDFCAPFPIQRLKRTVQPGLPFEEVSRPDLVLVTHNHYDHLDLATIRRLPAETLFVVPQGLGRWFQGLGRRNVREFGWWQSEQMEGFRISCVPSQHFSSRTPWDRNRTLWCGWVLQFGGRTVYVTGDTGYCPVFREIGERFGPMDLAMIPIGAYEPRWFMKSVHVDPDEAAQIHLDVRSKLSIACHWGTFCLTDEPMDEPPKLLGEALVKRGITAEAFRVLRVGERVGF